jgi:predicted nucleic acid-binding protein
VVLDSWAWIELFSGSERGSRIDRELSKASEVFTSSVTLAEIVSASARRGRPVEDKVLAVRGRSKVVSPSSEDSVGAGLLHAEVKQTSPNFSLADSFVLQLARKVGARVLTGDPDFRGVKEALLLE